MIVGIACIVMGCGMYVPTSLITHVYSIYLLRFKVVVLLEYFSFVFKRGPL